MHSACPNPLAPFLAQGGHLLLDGALATELERRGADLNDPLWSARVLLEQPELIEAVHLDYFRAGADVATTASYQATFEGFARRGLHPDQAADLMRRAVQLAVNARNRFWAEHCAEHGAAAGLATPPADPAQPVAGRHRPLVAASVGPYGAYLADGSEYRGHYGQSPQALADFHRPRLQVLARAGADLLACETLPSLTEALALAALMDTEQAVGWISFSCRDARHTCEGQPLADCAAALEPFASVLALGVNCTAPQHVAALLASARPHTTKPLLAYPNGGEVYDAVSKTWRADPAHAGGTAATLADHAQDWAHCGARLIGGCCRTGPADISALLGRWGRG
ncbi:homocysteine S-methyltransferase [Ideonella livida]|uniref:S-methylmethionine:homocysteine methyltransferase n=1 Tax=Ideonella livida TaxID=2707176 RepID=A0A7C9PJK8_9BURK|nr:homocysteine S-methyltransferase [Ideonella livida]NDY93309.1 homocysteine S-methyltransferase [Ideonella livida]